jgi:hypothetical protein
MTWKNVLKDQRPDYPDLDGDTEEPMVDALETVEQVKSVKKEFDEFGRDFDEQGLDAFGKPIPKRDEFLEEMKYLLKSYERMASSPKQQLRKIKEMLEDCERELKRRKGD